MRNKPWKNTNAVIELTSLLDVIFIVLMVVVCNQQINTRNQEEQAQAAMEQAVDLSVEAAAKEASVAAREENLAKLEAEAEAKLAEAEAMQDDVLAERDFYKEQLDTYENIEEQMLFIKIYVDYKPEDIKNRSIRIICGTKELEPIAVTPDDAVEPFNELNRILNDKIYENREKPVIISVFRDQILYRDEKAVSEVLTKLSEEHTNLFRK